MTTTTTKSTDPLAARYLGKNTWLIRFQCHGCDSEFEVCVKEGAENPTHCNDCKDEARRANGWTPENSR